MDAHETDKITELGDEKRALILPGGQTWIYRQPGGCLEIGHQDDAVTTHGDEVPHSLVHLCDDGDVWALAEGIIAVMSRVPKRF